MRRCFSLVAADIQRISKLAWASSIAAGEKNSRVGFPLAKSRIHPRWYPSLHPSNNPSQSLAPLGDGESSLPQGVTDVRPKALWICALG